MHFLPELFVLSMLHVICVCLCVKVISACHMVLGGKASREACTSWRSFRVMSSAWGFYPNNLPSSVGYRRMVIHENCHVNICFQHLPYISYLCFWILALLIVLWYWLLQLPFWYCSPSLAHHFFFLILPNPGFCNCVRWGHPNRHQNIEIIILFLRSLIIQRTFEMSTTNSPHICTLECVVVEGSCRCSFTVTNPGI